MSLHLLPRTTCPHCWTPFAPDEVYWVASHAELRGDSRLGDDALRRFPPTRFSIYGEALDEFGLPCHDLACPKCHLGLPRAALEMEPFIVSVIGTPASGKSYFLAAMRWELNRLLPAYFHVTVGDADPAANLTLSDYERALFLNPTGGTPQMLGDLIQKTQTGQKGHFDAVRFGGQEVIYPRPFLYALKPGSGHLNAAEAGRLSRLLCLYDVAGEHCLPGAADAFGTAATRHLAASHLLVYVFDPLQDARFRKALTANGRADGTAVSRQETALHEMATRIRRYTGLSQTAKLARPLVVAVTKSDTWGHLLADVDAVKEPYAKSSTSGQVGLNGQRVEAASLALRALLLKYCPEIARVAEDFADPLFVPVSALGTRPVPHPATGRPAVKPDDIKPHWVTVPLLAGARDGLKGLYYRLRG